MFNSAPVPTISEPPNVMLPPKIALPFTLTFLYAGRLWMVCTTLELVNSAVSGVNDPDARRIDPMAIALSSTPLPVVVWTLPATCIRPVPVSFAAVVMLRSAATLTVRVRVAVLSFIRTPRLSEIVR
jgi:hypothetical protein